MSTNTPCRHVRAHVNKNADQQWQASATYYYGDSMSKWWKSRGFRIVAVVILILLAIAAAIVRVVLFSKGILYGESAAKMASLAVAAIVVTVGAVIMKIRQAGQAPATQAPGAQASAAQAPAAKREESPGSVVVSISALLGLALVAYSVAELVAPNTPVAAGAPACPGAPVYGAPFLAQTTDLGANARSGPGRQYVQMNRYAANCTLGFDGYCIGSTELDSRLKTPDDRWLVVHGRSDQVISSAVLLDQSPLQDLGQTPSPACQRIGGLPEPQSVQNLVYNKNAKALSAQAPGAASVGYAVAVPAGKNPAYLPIGLGTSPPFFKVSWNLRDTLNQMPGSLNNTALWVGAAVCLADTVPVIKSFHALRLTIRNGVVIAQTPAVDLSSTIQAHLAQLACGASG
jgi:hypothetical protein